MSLDFAHLKVERQALTQPPCHLLLRSAVFLEDRDQMGRLEDLAQRLAQHVAFDSCRGFHLGLVYERDDSGDWLRPDLDQLLSTIDWVAPRAQVHAVVCNALHVEFASLPVLFGTIFTSVESMLKNTRAVIEQMGTYCRQIAQNLEFGLSVSYQPEIDCSAGLVSQIEPKLNALPQRSGSAYFRALAEKRSAQTRAKDDAAQIREKIVSHLNESPYSVRILPHRGEWSPESTNLLARVSLLVPRDMQASFPSWQADLQGHAVFRFCHCQWTGPWAPFSFLKEAIPKSPEV